MDIAAKRIWLERAVHRMPQRFNEVIKPAYAAAPSA